MSLRVKYTGTDVDTHTRLKGKLVIMFYYWCHGT